MNMSKFHFIAALVSVALLSFGCARKHNGSDTRGEEHTEAEHGDTGVTFKEGKGLRVPKSTAEFIGLKILDVGEQKIASTLRFTAKVYRQSTKDKLAGELHSTSASAFLRKGDAEKLKVAQPVNIETDGVTLTGKVAALNREMEKANGQIEVLLEIDDAQKPLAMGAYVEVVVPTGQQETIVGVPKEAVLKTAEGTFVYTVSGEHLVRSEIKIGEVSNDTIEVKDGLYAGDQIVVSPVMTLWMAELQSIRGGQACADGH